MEYISSRSDTIESFHERVTLGTKVSPIRGKGVTLQTISFYFMIIDDKIMELFGVLVPVHTRMNLCECICLLHNVRQ